MEGDKEIKPGDQQIPEQVRGSAVNTLAEADFSDAAEADAFYRIVRQRLLNVNQWYQYAGVPMAAFKLFDRSGRTVQRTAEQGDHIRIDIPGPGTKAGEGYDWVVIEKITEETEGDTRTISLLVRPSAHPLSGEETPAHFLKRSSTNTLQVKRTGLAVRAEQHGRNEEANNDTSSLLDNLRNTMVGWSSKLGFSYPQWKSLVDGLVKKDEQ